MLATAGPAAARTPGLDFYSSADGATELDSSEALFNRVVLASSPLLDVSVAGGRAREDRAARDRTWHVFLLADARVELAGGRWLQALHAGYTDHRQETRDGFASEILHVANLQDGRRLAVGTLQEVRISKQHTLALSLESRRQSLEDRQRIRRSHLPGSDLGGTWARSQARTHWALLEDRIQLGSWRLELGGGVEDRAERGARPLSRAALRWAARPGLELFGAAGTGLGDPARLASPLVGSTAGAADSTPIAHESNVDPAPTRAWQLGATRAFLHGRVTLGARLSQARTQGSFTALGGMLGDLELASAGAGTRTRAERLDTFLTLSPLEGARLDLAYSASAARVRDARPGARGSEERSVARRSARATLTLTPTAVDSLRITLRYIGKREPSGSAASRLASQIGGSAQGSYSACDVALSHALGARWRVSGQIENLLRREYEPGAVPAARVRGTLRIEAMF